MAQKTHFRPDQVEKIQELGSHLRETRQARAISLERVSAETRISLRLLQAIEQAEVETLPQSIYLKGLLKRYADALELNGAELANQLPAGDVLEGITPSWQNVPSSKRRSLPLYFIYIFALIGFISGLSYLLQRTPSEVARTGDRDRSVAETRNTERRTSSIEIEQQQSEPATPVSATQSARNKPVVVNITLKDDCWLQIVADGKTTFEGTLQKGEQRTWEAEEELVIRAGNAGGVAIAFNNEPAKPLGEPGAVETVTYQAPSSTKVQSQGG